jgi:tetratricopeptide (TPR) repeat protein
MVLSDTRIKLTVLQLKEAKSNFGELAPPFALSFNGDASLEAKQRFDALTAAQKLLTAILVLKSHVREGGLLKFFFNEPQWMWAQVSAALSAIGSEKWAGRFDAVLCEVEKLAEDLEVARAEWRASANVEIYARLSKAIHARVTDLEPLTADLHSQGFINIDDAATIFAAENVDDLVVLIEETRPLPHEDLKEVARRLYYECDQRPRSAVRAYRAYLAIAPGDADAWCELATVLTVSGDEEASFAAIREARRLAPHNGRVLREEQQKLASFYYARTDVSEGYEKAVRAASVKLFPDIQVLRNNLIGTLSELRAEPCHEADAIELDLKIAYLLNDSGRFREALEILERLFVNPPEQLSSATTHGHLAVVMGEAFVALGDFESALARFDAVEEKGEKPDYLDLHRVKVLRLAGRESDAVALSAVSNWGTFDGMN